MLSRSLLATLATTGLLLAQGALDLDKLTPGALGGNLLLQITGAPPNALGLLGISYTAGPTPIATFDPTDLRSLQVGIELANAWPILLFDGQGNSGFGLNLPTSAAFANLRFHWQGMILNTSGTGLVGSLSNPVLTQTSPPGVGQLATASLLAARSFATSFFDRNNNAGQGDVVIAGGGTGDLTNSTGLQTTEVWDFRRMRRLPGPNMTTARALHVAVPLLDGRVLLVGGVDAVGNVLASCEIYDPVSNSFSTTGSMGTGRALHAACRLADGRVMAAGGTSDLSDTTAAITNTLSSAEFYNPATGSWSNAPGIGGRRLAPALTLLGDNRVMVSGGVEVTLLLGLPIGAVSTNVVRFWNPANNSWSNGPNMNQGRAGHHFNQVTLTDGRILMTGGTFVPNLLGAANASPIQGAEVYNPATNSWTTATMPTARALHSATRLPDGRVVVCGGAQGTLTTPVSIDNVEIYSPATNSWTTLPNLTTARSGHAAELLPDGTVALFGGQGITATLQSVEMLRF